jgi:hypothetical protein
VFSKFGQYAQVAASRLSVKSALNPFLWLSGITTPVFLGAAWALSAHPAAMAVMLVMGALPVLVTCGVGVRFAVLDPSKLQSEDYQLREHTLQIIEQQSHGVIADGNTLVAIANPALPPLVVGQPVGYALPAGHENPVSVPAEIVNEEV